VIHDQILGVYAAPLGLRLPFRIVQDVQIEKKGAEDYDQGMPAVITLGDGSAVKGRTYSDFAGQAPIGDFDIALEKVASIAFNHKADAASSFVPHGRHTAIIHKADGGQVVLEGATFMGDHFDKDGDYLGESYVDTVDFESGGATFKIAWSKIAAVAFKKRGDKPPLSITMRDGQTVEGQAVCSLLSTSDIDGAISYAGHYKVEATYSLCRSYDRALDKVELRD
jgi:hypothetical protein